MKIIMAPTRNPGLWIALLLAIAGIGHAADDPAVDEPSSVSLFNEIPGSDVDTSRWRCKFCPDNAEEPWALEIEAGPGYVSDDSYKFGEYNGLNEDGLFLKLDIDSSYRDDEAHYFDFRARDLGLDSGRVDLEGGTQGSYEINLMLDQVYRNQLDTARTVYRGTTSQVLPPAWVAGASTAAMTTLDASLDDINFSTQRRLLSLGGRIIQNRKWSYDVRFERQTKEGEIPFGAAIGTTFADARSALLAKPIDFTTDRFELVANYRAKDVSGSLSFVLSEFENKNDALRWENAFSIGSSSGQVALEPDNQMHQISATGQYRGFDNVILNGSLMFARLTQDESFLPYTVNAAVIAPPLPRTSLDAVVDIARANANALWTLSGKSRVRFFYEYFEHVNDTDRATFTYVIADNALSGTPRANFPYEFRTQKLGTEVSHRLENQNKLSGGLEYRIHDRTFQEIDQSTETRLWGKYGKRTTTGVNYSVKLEGSSRESDSYDALAELIPPENPQLRKYNLADRDRVGASANIDFVASDRWFVNISLDHSRADYSNSSVGLNESKDLSLGLDLQYTLSDEISLTGYLNRTVISSTQDGSSVAGDPDWSVDNEDRVDTFGLGLSYAPTEKDFRLGADYFHNRATGEIEFSDASLTPLPDLESDLDNIEIYAEYDHSENLTYRASYAYEVYRETNWNLDDVSPGTIDNVLSLGESSPDYSVGVLWFSLKYRL